MPNGNAGLLLSLLGSLIGDSTPKKNDTYNPDDPSSHPYVDPGWATKFFHPEIASYEANQNLASFNTQLAHDTKRRVAAGDASLVAPFASKSVNEITDPNALAALTGDNPTSSELLTVNKNAALNKFGVPDAMAEQDAANLKFGTRELNAGLAAGNPEAKAKAENSRLNYESPYYQSETGLIQPRANLTKGQIASQETLLPYQTDEAKARAQEMTGESDRKIASKNQLDALYKTSLSNSLWDANHPPTAPEPFSRLNDGSYGRRPDYVPMAQKIAGELGQKTGNTVPVSQGLHLDLGGGRGQTIYKKFGSSFGDEADTKKETLSLKDALSSIGVDIGKDGKMELSSKYKMNPESGDYDIPLTEEEIAEIKQKANRIYNVYSKKK